MSQVNKDIKMLLVRIDAELNHIEREKERLPNIVQSEIEVFWNNLQSQEKESIEKETFIERYQDGLKQKFLSSLEMTASKLQVLRRQLAQDILGSE